MPSHFSTLGMAVDGEDELLQLAEAIGPLAQPVGFDGGTYFHWHDPSGAELWLQVNADNEFTGISRPTSSSATTRAAAMKPTK